MVVKYMLNKYPLFPMLALFLFFFTLFVCSIKNNEQIFVHLASSFLSGRLDLIENEKFFPLASYDDIVKYQDKYYWPEAPGPAIILLPFVFLAKIFGLVFQQSYLNFLLVIATALMLRKIIFRLNISKNNSYYWLATFLIASPFFYLSTISYGPYFAQIIAVFFVVCSVHEYYGQKRYFLIGLYLGLAGLTRLTAGLGIIYFLAELLLMFRQNKKNRAAIKKNFMLLIIPFLIIISFNFLYNYARFNNFLDSGYGLSAESGENIMFLNAYQHGLLSLKHLPGNLYFLFFASLHPITEKTNSPVLIFPYLKINYWGLGIFFISPYLLALFFYFKKTQQSLLLLSTVFLIALPILLFFGIGYAQIGYRYSMDFFVFLFLLLLISYHNTNQNGLSKRMKSLLAAAVIFNFYILLTV